LTRRLLSSILLTGLLVAAAPPPSPLATRIHNLLAQSPLAGTSFWGIEIVDVSSSAPIFRANENHFFVPASTTKLFTSALALSRLGPAFRIQTTVSSAQQPDANGLLAGDLVLNGAGDPSLKTADVEFLAEQIYQRGIRRVDGAVIGDDSAFLWEPYSPGWSIEDPVQGDGAPVSALTLNDNSVTLHLSPGSVSFDPPVPLFQVENQLEPNPIGPSIIHFERLPGSLNLRIWGTIQPDAKESTVSLSVDDPALYAAMVLFDALLRHGVSIEGKPHARHRRPGEKFPAPSAPCVLAVHESAPLVDDLRLTEKTSQNLHAETYLHLVALQRAGLGSRSAGLDELHDFLDVAKVPKDQYMLYDGSGLSRLNLLTPHAVTSLLSYMAKSTVNDDWFSLQAVAGVDGTLERRFKNVKIRGRISGKTGSLSHVSALSGYVTRKSGKQYAFSILVNNYNAHTAEIRDLIDKLVTLLVD
jgi:D-alanyl-D-alanine carboxypeptidase/D-alanyl-D-alanine-endopeptidase (penicillin-binding protein 4)